MKYKPLIKALVSFAILAMAADYVFTREAIYNNPSSDSNRIVHLLREKGDEIPIFGSSKVKYDYIPTEMGINAYNYGLDGTSYEVTDTFLQIELAKHKTSPIIIDLKPQAEYSIGDYSTYIPFAFDARIRQLLKHSSSMVWRYYCPGLRYFGYYDYYLKEYINNRFHMMRKVVRGFSYETSWAFDRARLDEAIRKRKLDTNGYFPDEEQNRRLLDKIQKHPDRLFFLVYSPVHSSCFTNFKNLDQFNAFKATLKALPNAYVLDFENLNYPDEWFKDTNHLLTDGAKDFSRRLGATMNGILLKRHMLGSVNEHLAPKNEANRD